MKEARYSCEGCGKRFHRNCHLKQHLQIKRNNGHCMGAREKVDHSCKICGWVFDRTSNLKRHMETQHQNYREEPRRSKRRAAADIEREAAEELDRRLTNDRYEFLELKDVNPTIGRGVFATIPFSPGQYVCRYEGELIDHVEAKKREVEYRKDSSLGSFMFYFRWGKQQKTWCIDPTKAEKALGNFINHSQNNGNLSPKVHEIGNRPCLYFVAKNQIEAGDQLLYDYGHRSKDSLKNFPFLGH